MKPYGDPEPQTDLKRPVRILPNPTCSLLKFYFASVNPKEVSDKKHSHKVDCAQSASARKAGRVNLGAKQQHYEHYNPRSTAARLNINPEQLNAFRCFQDYAPPTHKDIRISSPLPSPSNNHMVDTSLRKPFLSGHEDIICSSQNIKTSEAAMMCEKNKISYVMKVCKKKRERERDREYITALALCIF